MFYADVENEKASTWRIECRSRPHRFDVLSFSFFSSIVSKSIFVRYPITDNDRWLKACAERNRNGNPKPNPVPPLIPTPITILTPTPTPTPPGLFVISEFSRMYIMGKKLGEGTYAEVFEAKRRVPQAGGGQSYAVKRTSRKGLSKEDENALFEEVRDVLLR